METIKGTQLEAFPLDLREVVDLIYFDGPLLSLFESKTADYYLYYWCDADTNYNRWLIFRVSDTQIQLYLLKHLSLRDLILTPLDGYFFLCDIDNNWQYRNVYFVLSVNLPDIYTPAADSYHNESLGLSKKDKSILEHKFFTHLYLSKEGESVFSHILKDRSGGKSFIPLEALQYQEAKLSESSVD